MASGWSPQNWGHVQSQKPCLGRVHPPAGGGSTRATNGVGLGQSKSGPTQATGQASGRLARKASRSHQHQTNDVGSGSILRLRSDRIGQPNSHRWWKLDRLCRRMASRQGVGAVYRPLRPMLSIARGTAGYHDQRYTFALHRRRDQPDGWRALGSTPTAGGSATTPSGDYRPDCRRIASDVGSNRQRRTDRPGGGLRLLDSLGDQRVGLFTRYELIGDFRKVR